MINVNVEINGVSHSLQCEPYDKLAEVLRSNGYLGVKIGCEVGNCGSCTILLDGTPVKSCLVFACHVEGHKIVTIEGLGEPGDLHPLQRIFLEKGGVQCGYCVPGIILTAKALLDQNSSPTENDVKEALSGNLCRCTGYVKQIEAVLEARKELGGK